MSKLRRLTSKKPYSWWWDGHISPQNSKWLSDNLEEMNRLVKEMVMLIEQEGDSFAKRAEIYYERRPELIAHVEDLYRMYRALAEKYDNVTGELRSAMPSSKSISTSSSSSSSSNRDTTHEHKPPPINRAAGFDFFLGNSDGTPRKGTNSSSSSTESESDSDNPDNSEQVAMLEQEVAMLEQEVARLKDEAEELRARHVAAVEESNSKIAAMEANLKELNSKLESEREELGGDVEELKAELGNLKMEKIQVEALQREQVRLMEEVRKKAEVREEELQGEVKRERAVVEEVKEEKREAIRQLCFSLEYHRCRYEELCLFLRGKMIGRSRVM